MENVGIERFVGYAGADDSATGLVALVMRWLPFRRRVGVLAMSSEWLLDHQLHYSKHHW